MDVFAEYALTEVLGLTASLPLVWSDIGDDIWGIGAVHLGGHGRLRIADDHELVLRAGAQLPTENYPTDGTYTDQVLVRATAFQRLEDPMLSSGAVWLRGGASYRLRLGPVTGQVDYLVDLPVGGDLDAETQPAPDGFWARVVFAGGVAYAPGRWAGSPSRSTRSTDSTTSWSSASAPAAHFDPPRTRCRQSMAK